ncbi:sugar transferase [Tessaracoccus antarcticus]|uniref:sugar transferase n=1 Tax=Tessaracoccus antarcticus TaxID=2479848 RepID=UPI0018F31BDC|nr:sugar transferase [Tessaracoccus antarcticus]
MDAILVGATFILANVTSTRLRGSPETAISTEATLATGALILIWLMGLRLTGAYSVIHLGAGADEYKRVVNATAIAAGIFGIACFLFKYDYPRLTFAVWVAMGLLVLLVVRYTRRQIMHRLHLRGLLQTPVLVVGADHHVDEVHRALRRARWAGYKIVGAVTRERRLTTATGLPVLGEFSNLAEVISTQGIATVIFAEGSFTCPEEFRRLAWQLEECQVQMMVVPTLADVSAERLEFSPMAGLPLVHVARPRALKSLRWSKRAADVVASALLLLLAAPLLLITAVAVKLEDGGPVIFRQRRVGLNGEEFDCLKLRSMCIDAEAKIAALQSQNEGAGVLFKMTNDPRITTVGKFIRRFSIDELPQLWNTLRGDMSLVGPRPALPREVAQYDSDTMRRLHVRPGLTGLWQVSGRSNLSWEDTVRLDLYYVDNWSAVRDLMILAKTAKAVFGSSGAY